MTSRKPLPIIALALLAWIGCSGFVCAGEPIAYIPGGSAAFANANAASHSKDFVDGAIEMGPKLKARGWTRVFFHNPGGLHAIGWFPDPRNPWGEGEKTAQRLGQDTRLMHVNQWQLAKQGHVQFASDVKLRIFHLLLTEHYGVEEVIYYLGSPDPLDSPLIDGLECLKPFINAGRPETVSFAFDLLGYDELAVSEQKLLACRNLCNELRRYGHRVYLEPRMDQRVLFWKGFIAGTNATAAQDANHPEEVEASRELGEVLRLTTEGRENEIANWPKDVTVVYRDWRSKKAADVKGAK